MVKFSRPKDAAAAIIKLTKNYFVFQRRDNAPGTAFGGMLSLFGGAIEKGETPVEAIRRELYEELTYNFERIAFKSLGEVCFDFQELGLGNFRRAYFLIEISDAVTEKFIVTEGLGLKKLSSEEVVNNKEIVPYDLSFMWFFLNRKLFKVTHNQNLL